LQEDLQNRSVVLITRTTKLTGRVLAGLMRAALLEMRRFENAPKEGKQSMRQLAKGGPLQNIEISDDNIRAFGPFARKYGVSYSLQRDNSEIPPKWLVFFRAKDTDSLTAAFKAFSASVLNRERERPSVKDVMQKFRGILKNAVRSKTKHRHREGPEL
jgi:hypothetical protein